MRKLLLLEADKKEAQLLKRRLDDHGYETTVCYDGFTGKKLITKHLFDLVIGELNMPGINGIEICVFVKKYRLSLPMIITTSSLSIDHKMAAFDAGADDCLVKPFDFRELHARIKLSINKLTRSIATEHHLLKYADIQLDTITRNVKRGEINVKLTPKEFHLLEYLLDNPERVISRTEIADKVWNMDFNTGTNFIDVYINYLRRKIDKDFPEKLIHTRSRMGFVLMKEDKYLHAQHLPSRKPLIEINNRL